MYKYRLFSWLLLYITFSHIARCSLSFFFFHFDVFFFSCKTEIDNTSRLAQYDESGLTMKMERQTPRR